MVVLYRPCVRGAYGPDDLLDFVSTFDLEQAKPTGPTASLVVPAPLAPEPGMLLDFGGPSGRGHGPGTRAMRDLGRRLVYVIVKVVPRIPGGAYTDLRRIDTGSKPTPKPPAASEGILEPSSPRQADQAGERRPLKERLEDSGLRSYRRQGDLM